MCHLESLIAIIESLVAIIESLFRELNNFPGKVKRFIEKSDSMMAISD
jgi:hypothetical protein